MTHSGCFQPDPFCDGRSVASKSGSEQYQVEGTSFALVPAPCMSEATWNQVGFLFCNTVMCKSESRYKTGRKYCSHNTT